MIKRFNWWLKEFYGIGISRNDLVKGSLARAVEKFKDKQLNCVEVGVYKGVHAREMLRYLHIDTLYLIDPWENYELYHTKKENLSKIGDNTLKLLNKWKDSIVILREFSNTAVSKLRGLTFDYIYIDGNHDYEFVKLDIEQYYPLVKEGGILGGDDIDRTGVLRAVCEFATKNNIKIYANAKNWWFEK